MDNAIDTDRLKLNPKQVDGVLRRLEMAIEAEIKIDEGRPLLTIQDLEKLFRLYALDRKKLDVNFSKWLPAMEKIHLGFAPGETIVIMAETGIGKSALLQNVLWKQNLPTMFFSTEMAEVMTFMRQLQCANGKTEAELFADYEDGAEEPYLKKVFEGMSQCRFLHGSIDIDEIIPYVQKCELETNKKIRIIAVDHLDFVRGHGKNLYEQKSHAMRELHNIAVRTQSVVIIISQVSRPQNFIHGSPYRPNLHSGKGTGDIEQAADNVFSLWDPGKEVWEYDHPLTNLKMDILKLRRGKAGATIGLHYDGETMRIEQSEQWIKT